MINRRKAPWCFEGLNEKVIARPITATGNLFGAKGEAKPAQGESVEPAERAKQ